MTDQDKTTTTQTKVESEKASEPPKDTSSTVTEQSKVEVVRDAPQDED